MTLAVQLAKRLPTGFALDVSFLAESGVTILFGASGSGKTTILRCVAGLAQPDAGRIAIGDRTLFNGQSGESVPVPQRRIGYVFQQLALFPHLTVADNIGYGLTNTSSAERRARVAEAADSFRIANLLDRRPRQISGGEQQRTALARALVTNPDALLLDEPLSALDAHTRGTVRAELHELLRDLRLPTILVTHDFDDAATLADRVGVLVEGKVLQYGTADELVAEPNDAFVASFAGANVLVGTARPSGNGLTEVVLRTGGSLWTTDEGAGHVAVAVYPWEVSLSRETPDDSAQNHLRAPIASLVSLGNRVRVRIGPITAEVTTQSAERLGLREGDVVVASFKATGARLLPIA
jgi:molybdate transport system ATP-binding protein